MALRAILLRCDSHSLSLGWLDSYRCDFLQVDEQKKRINAEKKQDMSGSLALSSRLQNQISSICLCYQWLSFQR